MNKQQVRQVHKLFEEHMRGIGAMSLGTLTLYRRLPGDDFTLHTPSGPATLHLIDGHSRGSIPWLACRFEDPGKARANGLDCNPFSGKFNCHVWDEPARTVEELVAVFVGHVDRMVTAGRCTTVPIH